MHAQTPGQPGIRRGPRVGAADLGAELGATVLSAEPFLTVRAVDNAVNCFDCAARPPSSPRPGPALAPALATAPATAIVPPPPMPRAVLPEARRRGQAPSSSPLPRNQAPGRGAFLPGPSLGPAHAAAAATTVVRSRPPRLSPRPPSPASALPRNQAPGPRPARRASGQQPAAAFRGLLPRPGRSRRRGGGGEARRRLRPPLQGTEVFFCKIVTLNINVIS